MDKIKSFEEFTINEKGSALGFLGGILTGDINIFDNPTTATAPDAGVDTAG